MPTDGRRTKAQIREHKGDEERRAKREAERKLREQQTPGAATATATLRFTFCLQWLLRQHLEKSRQRCRDAADALFLIDVDRLQPRQSIGRLSQCSMYVLRFCHLSTCDVLPVSFVRPSCFSRCRRQPLPIIVFESCPLLWESTLHLR